MTLQGIYKHYKGGMYTVLFVARNSTNGADEGKNVVVYVSHKTGKVCVRDEQEFSQVVPVGPEHGFAEGAMTPRFSFAHAQMSDQQEIELYDDLLDFVGRKK